MIELSVIIVSFNTRQLLRECLASVYEDLTASGLAGEVLAVDNASRDGTAQMVAEEFPQVKLTASQRNLGFAAANNLALAEASGRYAFLLNPDTRLVPQALRRMLGFLEEHQEAGLAGPKLLHPDGSFQHSAFRFPTLAMAFLDFFPLNHRLIDSRLNGRYPTKCYAAPFPIDHPLGAAMMVRREVWEEVGGMDEDFFLYCEEIDWCLRLRAAGWEIWCVPGAEVIHHVAQSTRQASAAMYSELFRSRHRLFGKHYGRGYRWAVRGIIRLGLMRRILEARWRRLLGKLSPGELERELAIYKEIWRM